MLYVCLSAKKLLLEPMEKVGMFMIDVSCEAVREAGMGLVGGEWWEDGWVGLINEWWRMGGRGLIDEWWEDGWAWFDR